MAKKQKNHTDPESLLSEILKSLDNIKNGVSREEALTTKALELLTKHCEKSMRSLYYARSEDYQDCFQCAMMDIWMYWDGFDRNLQIKRLLNEFNIEVESRFVIENGKKYDNEAWYDKHIIVEHTNENDIPYSIESYPYKGLRTVVNVDMSVLSQSDQIEFQNRLKLLPKPNAFAYYSTFIFKGSTKGWNALYPAKYKGTISINGSGNAESEIYSI